MVWLSSSTFQALGGRNKEENMEHIRDIFLTIMWNKYRQAMRQGRTADSVGWLAMMDSIIETEQRGTK